MILEEGVQYSERHTSLLTPAAPGLSPTPPLRGPCAHSAHLWGWNTQQCPLFSDPGRETANWGTLPLPWSASLCQDAAWSHGDQSRQAWDAPQVPWSSWKFLLFQRSEGKEPLTFPLSGVKLDHSEGCTEVPALSAGLHVSVPKFSQRGR